MLRVAPRTFISADDEHIFSFEFDLRNGTEVSPALGTGTFGGEIVAVEAPQSKG